MLHNRTESKPNGESDHRTARRPGASLEGIAAAQRKSIQELALERLSSLVEVIPVPRAGSPAAVLRVMQEPPHPDLADVEELDAVITAGRLPIRTRDLFWD